MTNRYSFVMDGKPITLVPLTLKLIYDEQLKLKKWKVAEKKSLYIKETFANKILQSFNDDDVIF
jgi:hypothetical protein